jgi:hypothetical protein
VHLSSLTVTDNSPLNLTLSLETGFWINGTITKVVDTPVVPAFINFVMDSETGEHLKLPVPTNSDGLYRTFLPYRQYRIEILHTSSGNITYHYYNTTSFLEEDVKELAKQSSDTIKSGSRQSTLNPRITKNVHLFEASRLWGYVYWDHTNDSKFYYDNESYEQAMSGELPSDSSRGRGSSSSRSRTNGYGNVGNNSEFSDFQTEFSYFPNDFSGPQNELVRNARLVFYHETQTIYAYTNNNGYFSVFLPPGNTTIDIADPRFEPLEKTNSKEHLEIFMPFNRSYQVFGIPRNFSVVPKMTTVTGSVWFDKEENFILKEDEIVANVPVKFLLFNPLVTNADNNSFNVTLTSDQDGNYTAELVPGEYLVDIDYEASSSVRYTHSSFISIPLNNPYKEVIENIPVYKDIFINFSITTEDFDLNETDLENVTIQLFKESSDLLESSRLEINETYYKGYVPPMEYTIWIEYSASSGKGVTTGTKYVHFGRINISEVSNIFVIQLKRGIEFNFNGFVDSDNSGNYTEFEERPPEYNITLTEESGGVINLKYENASFSRFLEPEVSYNIYINDTRKQDATHGFRWVRYITNYTFKIPSNNTQYFADIPLIKYINLSGKVFYDENENSNADKNELYAGVIIHFNGPMKFTVFSNSSGRFNKFVLPGEYFATIEAPGFQDKPKVYSYNVTLDDTFYDIDMVPIRVRVFGFTYFDADRDMTYNPDFVLDNNKIDTKLGSVTIKFARNVLFETDIGQNLPTTEPLEETAKEVTSNANTGEYEIYLAPGEYNVNAYVTTKTGTTYCALDLRIIGHTDENDFNISLYEGRLVEGNVFYRDSDLNEIRDLDSRETGNGLKFENLETGGSKIVLYRYKGTIDKLNLPFGNYSVTTEFLTEEYGLSIDYTLTDTVWVRPDINWYTFEMNKENDYSVGIKVVSESEIELRTADIHENAFMLTVENEGNTYNVVDLHVEDVPDGWYVKLSNYTLPLDIAGTYKKANITLDITIPVEGYAVNKITLKAEPRGDPAAASSITLIVKTPASYDFKLDYEENLDRGIDFNDTLLFNVNLTKSGNAEDDIFFKFYNIQDTWNVSIPAAWEDNSGIEYLQDIDSFKVNMPQELENKIVTFQVQSPERLNATTGLATILVNSWSDNEPELEFTERIEVQIRKPDIILKDIKFKNQDLKEDTNVTIIGLTEVKDKYIDEVVYSLYVENVWVENKTVTDLAEDSMQRVEFYWQVSRYNLTEQRGEEFTFRIEVNSDETVEETDYQNNKISTIMLIGEEKLEEPFNWRPVYAMLTLIIVVLVVWGLYRWRRKI